MNKEKLSSIGTYILKGMTEREACILVGVPYDVFTEAKENDEATRTFVEKKNVEFKLKHVETIQKTKSEKNSMYLLEKLRPDEFGSKSKPVGITVNIISEILKDIANDNTTGLIAANRGEKQLIEDDSKRIIEGTAILN